MNPSKNITIKISIAIVLLILLCVLDLFFGGKQLGFVEAVRSLFSLSEGRDVSKVILWKIRFPRMMAAVLSGASLAVSGAAMQSIFRNPLADPHIMGVSSGAGFAAALACSFAGTSAGLFSGMTIMAAAFVGALLSSSLVVCVSSKVKSSSTLLLFGVMLGFVFSAMTSLTEYFSSEQSLKMFYLWSAGSFSSAGSQQNLLLAVSLVVGLLFVLVQCKGLDVLLFGDRYASLSGAGVKRIRVISLLGCCIMTGSVTAVCGPLGFVGIVSAHVSRRVLGTAVHRYVIPMAVVVGGCFCVLGDLLSQIWSSPLPPGSVLAIIGAPIVILILFKDRQ